MPKETIQDVAGTYDVRVGWSDNTVQVGVETAAGHSLVSMLYGDPEVLERIGLRVHVAAQQDPTRTADRLGREVLDIIESSQTNPGEPSYTGVWAVLDRAKINDMIRLLRKARDRAYGQDA